MKQLRTKFYGQAGEHYVMFRLWECEIVALMAPDGSKGVDLLLYGKNYDLLATVQVKTRSTKERKGWIVQRKHLNYVSNNHFYILVELDIHPKGIPTSYVVPSVVIADIGRRAIENEAGIIAEIGEENVKAATKNSNSVSFFFLKSMLEKPHPCLPSNWLAGFENAYETLTMDLFRNAANRAASNTPVQK